MGSLLVTAIQSNDYNVVIGLSFIYSAMYIGIMLVVDLLYGIIDPRIRLAKGDDVIWQKKRFDWAAKAPPQPSRRPCRNCTLSTSSPSRVCPEGQRG